MPVTVSESAFCGQTGCLDRKSESSSVKEKVQFSGDKRPSGRKKRELPFGDSLFYVQIQGFDPAERREYLERKMSWMTF